MAELRLLPVVPGRRRHLDNHVKQARHAQHCLAVYCTSPAARSLPGRVSILARPMDVCVLPVVLDSRADEACIQAG